MGIELLAAGGIGLLGNWLGGREQAGAARDVAGMQTLAQLEALRLQTEASERSMEVYADAMRESAKIQSDAELEIARMQEGGLDKQLAYQVNFLNNYRQDLAQAVQAGQMNVTQAFDQARGDIQAGGTQVQDIYLAGIEGLGPYAGAGVNALARAEKLFEMGPGELTPQQERQFGRGIEAVQAASSKISGGGVSSRMLENAMTYGRDFEIRRFNEELNRLMPLLQMGQETSAIQAALRGQSANLLTNLTTTGARFAAEEGVTLADLELEGAVGSFDVDELSEITAGKGDRGRSRRPEQIIDMPPGPTPVVSMERAGNVFVAATGRSPTTDESNQLRRAREAGWTEEDIRLASGALVPTRTQPRVHTGSFG